MNWLRIASFIFLGSIGLIALSMVMVSAREHYYSWSDMLLAWAAGILQVVAFLFFCALVILAIVIAIWGHL